MGGCARRSTPGFLFCGSDLVASGCREKFRKEFPKQVARQLRHEAKSQCKLGQSWKASSRNANQ